MRKGRIFVEMFKGGETNICYNALDRHVKEGKGEADCLLWEGNDEGEDAKWSYQQVWCWCMAVYVAML